MAQEYYSFMMNHFFETLFIQLMANIQHYSTLNCDSQQTGGVCSVCPAALLPRPTQAPPAGCGEGGARGPHRDTARPLSLFTRSLALTVASIAVFIIPVYQREVC